MTEKIKLGNKIRSLIKESEYKSAVNFQKKIRSTFSENSISLKTLERCLLNIGHIREASLFQIAFILNKKLSELREGTDSEAGQEAAPLGIFTYNKKARLTKLTDKLPFIPTKTILKQGGKTDTNLQDPQDGTNHIKWVYITKGKIELHIERELELKLEVHALKYGEHFAFDSTQIHYFKNISTSASSFLTINYPKID